MGSITTADKAVSTEEGPDDGGGGGEFGSEDVERLYRPEDEPDHLQERFYHNTCFEVAQLQAVLNQLVENKVEAIKQEAASAQEKRRRKFLLMRLIRSPGAMVRRLKRRGSTSADTKPPRGGGGKGVGDQRQSGDRKRRKRNIDEGGGASGSGGNGSNKGKRVNKQRIGSSSRPESPRYNPGIYHEDSPQHSDDDIVFLPSPCCCDTDGHTTIPVDPAIDSDYISVKIDDDDDDEDMVYAREPQPPRCHFSHPEAHHLHHHSHQEPYDSNSWRHSCDTSANVGVTPTLNRVNIMGAQTDCSEEDEIKKGERLARRHRRRRRRKRRRREKLAAVQAAQGHRYLPPHLRAVAVSVNEMRVIDPDELSKKARLAIAATACLLLFMCLLLVGVTLRMAPLIDEMVREQNRDLLKSLQREPATTLMPSTPASPPPPNIGGLSERIQDPQQLQQKQHNRQLTRAAAAVTAATTAAAEV